MSFQPSTPDGAKKPVKVTQLLRAKEVAAVPLTNWSAPDLQAEMARAARKSFERALAAARADVAEDLERWRQATLSEAKKEGWAQGFQQATQEGYEAGYAQGYAEVKAVLQAEYEAKNTAWQQEHDQLHQQMTSQWQTLVMSMTESLSAVEDEVAQDLVWLASTLAERIVMASLRIDPSLVQQLVRMVLDQLPKVVYPLQIGVHPDDLAWLEQMSLPAEGKVDWVVDRQLQQGEVWVKSGHGEAVLSWQQRVTQVAEAAMAQLVAERQSVKPSDA
jgi:flagellar assembly protein FliH